MTTTDDPLVSTDWLAAHLDDPKVKIIDASFKMPGVLPLPVDDYLAAHIPGAVFFDVDAIVRSRQSAAAYVSGRRAVRARRRRARHFHRRYRGGLRFRRLGRRAPGVVDVPVVRPSQREGAGWRPEEMGRAKAARRSPARSRRSPAKFQAKLDPSYVRSKQQLLGNLETAAEQVVDARAAPAFRGHGRRAAAGPALRPYSRQPQRALRRIVRCRDRRDEAAGGICAKAFSGAGVDLTKPIVTSCGSGVSALVLTLALYRLGVRGSALYDGSWAEWGLPDGPPIATGPA